MIEDKYGDLMKFIVPTEEPLRVLLIESVGYLKALREKLPQAEIYAVVHDEDICTEECYTGLGVHWTVLDYMSEPLPFEREFFDIVMGDQCLEQVGNPQDIASGFGLYIKSTGCFMTTFTNARYWRIIRALMQGHFYHICSHIFSKNEMLNLLFASFYKDASFAPVEDDYSNDADFIKQLEQFGFENLDGDLGIRTWMVMATKSSPEILELKRYYTPAIRREMVNRLRRIEFGIDIEPNLKALVELWNREKIFPAYIANFILETIMHTKDFLTNCVLGLYALGEKTLAGELVEEMERAYGFHQDYQLVADWQAQLATGKVDAMALNPKIVHDNYDEKAAKSLPADQRVAFITCVNNEDWYRECELYLRHLTIPAGMGIELIPVRNASSMCQGYNQGMRQTDAKYKVYIHQDTLIVNPDFISDMLRIFADKAVGAMGVIGCRSLPSSGIWWDGMRMVGRVLHACESESVVDSICNEVDGACVEVEAIDGLMVATQVDLPWREDLFTGWHFYEIAQCKELQRRGYKVVVPRQESYWCIHSPKEKPLDPSYKKYQKIFLKEYGNELDPEI